MAGRIIGVDLALMCLSLFKLVMGLKTLLVCSFALFVCLYIFSPEK